MLIDGIYFFAPFLNLLNRFILFRNAYSFKLSDAAASGLLCDNSPRWKVTLGRLHRAFPFQPNPQKRVR